LKEEKEKQKKLAPAAAAVVIIIMVFCVCPHILFYKLKRTSFLHLGHSALGVLDRIFVFCVS
jgi:hypothetical protein